MAAHIFDPEIAMKVGINAAVIYQNIIWWCEKNEANGRNIHDGNAWTYNSITAFEKQFPYLTKSQIRTALDKLDQSGLVLVGCFNTDPRDKTKWYAINRTCICEKSQMELSKIADPFAKNHKPLPDSKPDNKPDTPPKPPEGAGDLFSANGETVPHQQAADKSDPVKDGFDEIWSAFPRKPNMPGKGVCLKAYSKALKDVSHGDLMKAVRAYAASRVGEDPKYHARLSKWLNDGNYESFLDAEASENFREEDLSAPRRSMLQDGICPPSMKDADGKPNAEARHWLKRYGHGGNAA